MNRLRRPLLSIVVLLVVLAVGLAVAWNLRTASAVDFGRWRVIVLQSDDWGFEGWFPDRETADALADLADGVPPALRAYARSGLETAADVDTMRLRLARMRDADGLPLVLQANTILAGPTVAAAAAGDAPFGWPVHRAGSSNGRYGRPGLEAAVDRAIAAGVWWPELHGLTHFDLRAYARARAADDPVAARARAFDVMAYEGWLRGTELADGDPERARRVAEASVGTFRERFGRTPASVIAPDYRWGGEDEDAWWALGLQVVQAKREQVDDAVDPTDPVGRLRKAVSRWIDQLRGRFVYLDRPARLEPYGDASLDAPQGARAAAAAVREAWARGHPGIVSIHRVQWVSFDEHVGAAGWRHLEAMVEDLAADGPVRCLVDVELAQLHRRGWSWIERGPWTVLRNYTDGPVTPDDGPLAGRTFPVGTHVLDAAGGETTPR